MLLRLALVFLVLVAAAQALPTQSTVGRLLRFRNKEQLQDQDVAAHATNPTWGHFRPAQADDPNFDGTLGNTTHGARPAGVFFILERGDYSLDTWYPRRPTGRSGNKYWRLKAPLADIRFFQNGATGAGSPTHTLDQFTFYTCYPQGDSMHGNPKKPSTNGPQMLIVAVHPSDAAANTWVGTTHARDTTTQNTDGSLIYNNGDVSKWIEHKKSKGGKISWWADQHYLDGTGGQPKGTINLFIIASPDLSNMGANWQQAKRK